MKKCMILCIMCFALFANVYAEVLAAFPDMITPRELRMDGGYIYVSDQFSVLAYDMKTFKRVKTLGRKGEGPQEFRAWPGATFTKDKLILSDPYKIIIYSKDFKLLREISLRSHSGRVHPVEDFFVLTKSQVIDQKEYTIFALYNSKLEKIKDLVIEPYNEYNSKYFLTPFSRSRT